MTELDNLQNNADGENNTNLNPDENQNETVQQHQELSKAEEQSLEDISHSESETPPTSEEKNESVEQEEAVTLEEPILIEEDSDNQTEEGQVSDEKIEDYKHEDSEESQEVEEDEHQIPFKNYEELPLAVLIGEAKELLKNHQARMLREHFNQIRETVKRLLEEDEAAKKEAFVEEGGNPIDFQYDNPAKREFNKIFSDYKNQLDLYYKGQEKLQQENLKVRLQIIEDLKSLYQDSTEETSNIFTKFRKIKTLWHNAGPIPRAQSGNIFKTYFHHLDNFYKYLDMNKELREMDYAHNLEVRESIIKRAEELLTEDNVQKALNELQYLHKLWKEEAVPVAEEMREPTWQKFKELTLKIHERKTELSEKIREEQEENYRKKREVLDQIIEIYTNADKKSHGEWQSGIKKLNKLREDFISIGRVPRESNQKLWNEFKQYTREFNHKKNEFYKSLKTEQQENLSKKEELLRIAREHAESNDWDKSVQIIKKIQSDWKKIGHVPRRQSDKIWKDFKDACNKFFDNYKARSSRVSHEFENNLEQKEALLSELKEFKPSGDRQSDMNAINDFNIRWSSIGKVPAARMSINSEFNKALSSLISSSGLSEDKIKEFKMSALFDKIKSDQDSQMLDDEIRRTKKLIEDIEKEVNQLETNIGFFSNENSPLLKNVHKQIEEKRNRLSEAEFKLKKLHRINFEEESENNAENKESDAGEETAEN